MAKNHKNLWNVIGLEIEAILALGDEDQTGSSAILFQNLES